MPRLDLWRLSSLKHADTVIVPVIDNLDRPIPEEPLRALRAPSVVAPVLLRFVPGLSFLRKPAQTGALDGLKATTHWLPAPELARRRPPAAGVPPAPSLDQGNALIL